MALRFKLDENLPRDAQALLAEAGHDARTVHDERLHGCPDADILDACLNEDRILVTLDLDFADIRQYPPTSHRGIWVLQPENQSMESIVSVPRGALSLLDTEPTVNRLWIVEATRVRIRE